MFNLVPWTAAVVLFYDEKRVEEVSVVLIMVDDSMISCVVPLTKSAKTVDMVSVPVSKMFDV